MNTRIKVYQAADGKQPFTDWLRGLKDKQARSRIRVRIARLQLGNLGDCKSVCTGLLELRIDHGQVIGSISRDAGIRWCCCCARVTNAHRRRTSNEPVHSLPITKRG